MTVSLLRIAGFSDDTDKTEEGKDSNETATITSNLYGFDYQVTVTDFKHKTKVDGKTLKDLVANASKEAYFADGLERLYVREPNNTNAKRSKVVAF